MKIPCFWRHLVFPQFPTTERCVYMGSSKEQNIIATERSSFNEKETSGI